MFHHQRRRCVHILIAQTTFRAFLQQFLYLFLGFVFHTQSSIIHSSNCFSSSLGTFPDKLLGGSHKHLHKNCSLKTPGRSVRERERQTEGGQRRKSAQACPCVCISACTYRPNICCLPACTYSTNINICWRLGWAITYIWSLLEQLVMSLHFFVNDSCNYSRLVINEDQLAVFVLILRKWKKNLKLIFLVPLFTPGATSQ